MLQFLPNIGHRPLNILLLGAHSDDVEIGCGGAVMSLVRTYPSARFTWVTFGADAQRAAETRAAAEQLLTGTGERSILVEGFRTSYFPHAGEALKDYFDTLKQYSPDLIFTH